MLACLLFIPASASEELALFVDKCDSLPHRQSKPPRRNSPSTGMNATGQYNHLADLVLLDRDPLLDIANTKAIAAVLADGRYYDRAALDAMVQRVASLMDEETKKLAKPVH